MRYFSFILFIVMSQPGHAEMYDAQYQTCSSGTTVEIVECVNRATKEWDLRLNTSYKALMGRVDEGQREPLKAAQRLWIKYRDANCTLYASREGTIRQIEGAECMRAMTKSRTCELEAIHRYEAMPDDGCR